MNLQKSYIQKEQTKQNLLDVMHTLRQADTILSRNNHYIHDRYEIVN